MGQGGFIGHTMLLGPVLGCLEKDVETPDAPHQGVPALVPVLKRKLLQGLIKEGPNLGQQLYFFIFWNLSHFYP